MSGNTTSNTELLIRSELWSANLKETLRDAMMAQGFVDDMTEFTDGDQMTVPSIGQAQVDNYEEDGEVVYRPMDTGEFTFTIDKYLSSGNYMTEKQRQDSFYAEKMLAAFPMEQERAIMANFETAVFAAPEVGVAANSNEAIDGYETRWAGGGTGGAIAVEDFAKARGVLKRLNVPDTNLVAVVDPSVEFTLNSLSALVAVSDNPRWEGIVADGIATGMRFIKNVYGFDVYTSNYLATATDNALPDADDSNVDFSSVNGKVNLFFSAAPQVLPWVGSWRQLPKVDYEWVKDRQRHEFLTTARYGVKEYRPENMVEIVAKDMLK